MTTEQREDMRRISEIGGCALSSAFAVPLPLDESTNSQARDAGFFPGADDRYHPLPSRSSRQASRQALFRR